jgi:hypothetical protein
MQHPFTYSLLLPSSAITKKSGYSIYVETKEFKLMYIVSYIIPLASDRVVESHLVFR